MAIRKSFSYLKLCNFKALRKEKQMKRENFGSRLGFLLVSAGCAIGLGNVWKFPYITGLYGGGVFVLFYFLFLAIMGVPVLTMELSVGRASRKSVVAAYQELEPAGSKWHLHGWVALAGNYILMMFYTTVSGWMTGFFIRYVTGGFNGLEGAEIDGVYSAMQSNPVEMVLLMGFVVVSGFLVCSMGLQKGVERITKVMMLGLLGLIMVLAVNSCLLPGAAEGLKFYLLPDFDRAAEAGFGNIITAAGMGVALDFGLALVAALCGEEKAAALRAAVQASA